MQCVGHGVLFRGFLPSTEQREKSESILKSDQGLFWRGREKHRSHLTRAVSPNHPVVMVTARGGWEKMSASRLRAGSMCVNESESVCRAVCLVFLSFVAIPGYTFCE